VSTDRIKELEEKIADLKAVQIVRM